MANLLIRDLPDDLHRWLRQDAEANHRSANRHAIALLESVRRAPNAAVAAQVRTVDPVKLAALRAKVREVQRFVAALPEPDFTLTDDEILGYDEHGLPT